MDKIKTEKVGVDLYWRTIMQRAPVSEICDASCREFFLEYFQRGGEDQFRPQKIVAVFCYCKRQLFHEFRKSNKLPEKVKKCCCFFPKIPSNSRLGAPNKDNNKKIVINNDNNNNNDKPGHCPML